MIEFVLNGKSVALEVLQDMPLLWVLRDILGLTGTKYSCGKGLCGACNVLVDGEVVHFLRHARFLCSRRKGHHD